MMRSGIVAVRLITCVGYGPFGIIAIPVELLYVHRNSCLLKVATMVSSVLELTRLTPKFFNL